MGVAQLTKEWDAIDSLVMRQRSRVTVLRLLELKVCEVDASCELPLSDILLLQYKFFLQQNFRSANMRLARRSSWRSEGLGNGM
jgi:hypothetical protein